jgi:glycosyltransferase involved in cell wall biosynthesis
MRVLFDHPSPFALAHGGFQTQIEQTATALRSIGVEIEFVRWWDDTQTGDIIHYFGRPAGDYIRQAHRQGRKVVVAELLTALGSRTALQRLIQRNVINLAKCLLPQSFTVRMAWEAYQLADAAVALTPWEAQLMNTMFGASASKTHVIPNGVETPFLEAPERPRGAWLVCTATITERKRVLELAEAAALAQTPVWIIGKAYSGTDPYALRFEGLVRRHPQWVRYDGPVQDRIRLAEIYREARGFVLLSSMESLSLSALEAAACGCPLLLSDLPWARTSFGTSAAYCPVTSNLSRTAAALKSFYREAPQLPTPPSPASWIEVAQQFRNLYAQLLSTSR